MNKYTDEKLNLEILAEEAGEITEVLGRIIRMKSKIRRFGLYDRHPKNHHENIHALEEEIGHFGALIDILTDQGTLSNKAIVKANLSKRKTLVEYYTPMDQEPIKDLNCGICGKKIRGRQWHKRQEGFGICPDCFEFLRLSSDEETVCATYGTRGYHHNIKWTE